MPDWNSRIIEEFRANDGTVTTPGFGRSLVLVHHIGAKSGIERISPVMGLPNGTGGWWIAASKAGAPENPARYYNLLAHPETTIEAPDEGLVEVTARDLPPAERDAAWQRFTEASEGFRTDEQQTSQIIPVLELSRR